MDEKQEQKQEQDVQDAQERREDRQKEESERYMRLFAEFDNFRKRTERERSSYFENGARDVLLKILPTLDNLERAFAADDDGAKFKEGVEMIYGGLKTALETIGVKEIPAKGEQFDPNVHNAVMHAEDADFGANVVAEELQKGYFYKDKPLRHSMVKVVN